MTTIIISCFAGSDLPSSFAGSWIAIYTRNPSHAPRAARFCTVGLVKSSHNACGPWKLAGAQITVAMHSAQPPMWPYINEWIFIIETSKAPILEGTTFRRISESADFRLPIRSFIAGPQPSLGIRPNCCWLDTHPQAAYARFWRFPKSSGYPFVAGWLGFQWISRKIRKHLQKSHGPPPPPKLLLKTFQWRIFFLENLHNICRPFGRRRVALLRHGSPKDLSKCRPSHWVLEIHAAENIKAVCNNVGPPNDS